VRAEPLSITHGVEKLTLRFDCKPCEMHVVGSLKRTVASEARSRERASLATPEPIHFYRTAARNLS
jgi:23S rRNA 5-hydroxycytidine C2501 synthase